MQRGYQQLPEPIRRAGKRALGSSWRVLKRPAGVRICVYHHVGQDEWDALRRQLDWMQTAGEIVAYSQAVALAREARHGHTVFALSFDDGYRSWPAVAAELVARGMSGMFFTVTGRLDSPGVGLDWSDMREISALGMEVGSHTTEHVYLAEQSDPDAEAALRDSKSKLEQRLGVACTHFAFPCGVPVRAFAPHHVPMVRRHGYDSAASTIVGRQRLHDDPFLIRRTRLEVHWPLAEVAFALSRRGPSTAFGARRT